MKNKNYGWTVCCACSHTFCDVTLQVNEEAFIMAQLSSPTTHSNIILIYINLSTALPISRFVDFCFMLMAITVVCAHGSVDASAPASST